MQRPRFSSRLPSNTVSIHYHDWLLFMCFCATSADCKRIPSYLINGYKPMRCACVLSAGGDCEEIERNLCSGVALPVSRGQTVWFIYDTLSIMTLSLISDINVLLVCVMGCFYALMSVWLVFVCCYFYLKTKNVCVCSTSSRSWGRLSEPNRSLLPRWTQLFG